MVDGDVDTYGFELPGDHVGVLLLHGFSGAPVEMRALGESLCRHGRSVLAPRLPGHGTKPEDLAGVPWQRWVDAGLEGYARLRSHCDEVFVCGLSMGTLVCAYVCADNPVSGFIAMAPPLRPRDPLFLAGAVKLVKPMFAAKPPEKQTHLPTGNAAMWSYDRIPTAAIHELHKLIRSTPAVLARVSCPLLVLQGRHDAAVKEAGVLEFLSVADTGDKELIWLENTGHAVPVENERELVFQHVKDFVDRHSRD